MASVSLDPPLYTAAAKGDALAVARMLADGADPGAVDRVRGARMAASAACAAPAVVWALRHVFTLVYTRGALWMSSRRRRAHSAGTRRSGERHPRGTWTSSSPSRPPARTWECGILRRSARRHVARHLCGPGASAHNPRLQAAYTPLMYAATGNHAPLARVLILAGAEVDARTHDAVRAARSEGAPAARCCAFGDAVRAVGRGAIALRKLNMAALRCCGPNACHG